MSKLYDDIMQLLHEAGAFAETEKQKKAARAVLQARQIAEAEILYGSAKIQA